MKILEKSLDERSGCLSLLTTMSLDEYKSIVYSSFENGGNLDGQRDVIKRSSVASKIKKRMNDDFNSGAIFPHVVVGILASGEDFEKIKRDEKEFNPKHFLADSISIIDGMQRSNIYFTNYTGNEDRIIRVEFWISDKTVKLLYRMLVLNTGQVPWNTRRQVEVVFSSLSKAIIESVKSKNPDIASYVEIISVDDAKRRTQAGKYHKSTMIELYLGFNTRKAKVDVGDELADEFQRFDMMESIEKDVNFDLFIDVFSYLCRLDTAFSASHSSADNGQFKDGNDIFGSVPACLGFVVACSEYIMGKIPVERTPEIKIEKNQKLKGQIDKLIDILSEHKEGDFLALRSLNEIIDQLSKNRIGDEMRRTFKTIFSELLKYEDLEEIQSMEAFWRS